MGGNANFFNEKPKAGMTDSVCRFSVEESWGLDSLMNGSWSRGKGFR